MKHDSGFERAMKFMTSPYGLDSQRADINNKSEAWSRASRRVLIVWASLHSERLLPCRYS